MTMNSGLRGAHSLGQFSLEELWSLLPDFEMITQNHFYDPALYPERYIILWGRRLPFSDEYNSLTA